MKSRANIQKKCYLCAIKPQKNIRNMYIIGIAGGTGSGKTTVVRKILEALPCNEVALIPQDSYYNDTSLLSMEERRQINFDHPDALNDNDTRSSS